MKENHIQDLLKFEESCEKLRNFVQKTFYKEDGSLKGNSFCYYPIYQNRLSPIRNSIEVFGFLGIEYLEREKKTQKNQETS